MVGETPKPIRALSWFDELTANGMNRLPPSSLESWVLRVGACYAAMSEPVEARPLNRVAGTLCQRWEIVRVLSKRLGVSTASPGKHRPTQQLGVVAGNESGDARHVVRISQLRHLLIV